MSSEGSESDRSELPTPYRLQQARRKGQVARGMDLGFLVGLGAFFGFAWFLGGGALADLALIAQRTLAAAPSVSGTPQGLLAVVGAGLAAIARPLMLLAGAVFLAVLIFELVQTGPVFAPIKLDFSRLNPAQGLKRLFSLRLLLETGKTLIKVAAYGMVGWLAIRGAMQAATPVTTDAAALAEGLRRDALRLLAMVLGVAAGVAILDQLIARRDFTKRMRMSRRDIRRESRDREGEPRQKQKRKQLHREFVKSSESLRNIRGADVLVTNPSHYAVALRYDPATMSAPMVVSRGAHRFALRLRRLAFLYGVAIVREPALARALYRCEINQPTPEALYRPVADLYRALRARQAPPAQEATRV